MKSKIIYTTLIISVLIAFTQCKEDDYEEELKTANRAVGSYSWDITEDQKAVWGEFELVLEMKKASYKLEENIDFEVYFSNVGPITIKFPSIYPMTQMGGPPHISVWSTEQKFSIIETAEELKNDEEIIIEPIGKVTLARFNLNNVEGAIWQKQNNWEQEMEITNIGEVLKKGTYYATVFFTPKNQAYDSATDTLSFIIE